MSAVWLAVLTSTLTCAPPSPHAPRWFIFLTVGDNDNTALYGNRSLRQLAKAGKIPLAMLEGGGDDRSLRSSPGDAPPPERRPGARRNQNSSGRQNIGLTVQRSSATRQSSLGAGPIFVRPGQQNQNPKPKQQQQHRNVCRNKVLQQPPNRPEGKGDMPQLPLPLGLPRFLAPRATVVPPPVREMGARSRRGPSSSSDGVGRTVGAALPPLRIATGIAPGLHQRVPKPALQETAMVIGGPGAGAGGMTNIARGMAMGSRAVDPSALPPLRGGRTDRPYSH